MLMLIVHKNIIYDNIIFAFVTFRSKLRIHINPSDFRHIYFDPLPIYACNLISYLLVHPSPPPHNPHHINITFSSKTSILDPCSNWTLDMTVSRLNGLLPLPILNKTLNIITPFVLAVRYVSSLIVFHFDMFDDSDRSPDWRMFSSRLI